MLTAILSGMEDQVRFFKLKDFPGGPVVKNPPASAGDMGSIPELRRFHRPRGTSARVPQLLSLHSRAREPQLLSSLTLELVLCNKRSHCRETAWRCN